MSWSTKYKKSIDCSNPKGFSQKAHCAGRKKRRGGGKTQSKSVSETMKLSELKEVIREVSRESFYNSLNESIPKIYLKYLAVQKKLRELEDEQKKMLNQWKSEKNPKKKEKIFDKMRTGTKRLQATRKNLSDLENDYINKMSYDDSYSESVNEGKEPEIITQLRDVVKNGYRTIKDPKSGKKMKVDSYSASAMVGVYDKLNSSNQQKFIKQGLLGMQSLAFKLLK